MPGLGPVGDRLASVPTGPSVEHLFAWQLDLENVRRAREGKKSLTPSEAWEQVKRKAEIHERRG